MDHKTFSAYTLKSDPQQGIVESIVAVMGNDDQTDDIIHNGAFTKSIQERRGKIRVLDQHKTDSIMNVIGKPLEMREMSRDQLPADLLQRYPMATGGLYTKTQYLMDTPEGKGAFQRIAAGAVDEYSIGYDALDVDFSKLKKSDGSEKTIRNLRTIKLYEYSPVIWGANSATTTLSTKGATGASNLPLADRAKAWDSTGAEGRVRSWAGATDAPNAKYRDAFFWVNSDAPDNFTSYKLQFADIVDGKLTAIPRGIFAVAEVLQGSRGGTNIPQADQDAIKSKVNAYYKRMAKEFDDDSIVAPWEAKSIDLTSYVQEVTEAFNEMYGMVGDMGMMSECFCIWRVFDDHLIVCEMFSGDYYSVAYTMINGDPQFATQDTWIEGDLQFTPDLIDTGEMKQRENKAVKPRRQVKAGRVFAARNMDRLKRIMAEMQALMNEMDTEEQPANEGDTTTTDNAPAAKRAAVPDASTQAGPSTTTPTDEALKRIIEIELAQLQLMEV